MIANIHIKPFHNPQLMLQFWLGVEMMGYTASAMAYIPSIPRFDLVCILSHTYTAAQKWIILIIDKSDNLMERIICNL
jgi:hypothetical protein